MLSQRLPVLHLKWQKVGLQYKVDVLNSATYRNKIHIFEGYVVRCDFKNGFQTDI
jgi:hypothetical protein